MTGAAELSVITNLQMQAKKAGFEIAPSSYSRGDRIGLYTDNNKLELDDDGNFHVPTWCVWRRGEEIYTGSAEMILSFLTGMRVQREYDHMLGWNDKKRAVAERKFVEKYKNKRLIEALSNPENKSEDEEAPF